MDAALIWFFKLQVQLQCRFVLWANESLEAAVARRQAAETFYAIQNLLNAAANLAKALWGQQDKPETMIERKPLRDDIGVSDGSPLRNVRVRNKFEHFDECLAEWYRKGGTKYDDLNIGRQWALDPEAVFRSYDPVGKVIRIGNHKFRVQDIVDEVSQILAMMTIESLPPPPQKQAAAAASRKSRNAGKAE